VQPPVGSFSRRRRGGEPMHEHDRVNGWRVSIARAATPSACACRVRTRITVDVVIDDDVLVEARSQVDCAICPWLDAAGGPVLGRFELSPAAGRA
jgi:hypothetical protein